MSGSVAKPVGIASAFHLIGNTTQVILAAVRVVDRGYIIVRNTGAVNSAILNILSSSDGGLNFHVIPDPHLDSDGVAPSTNVEPIALPLPVERGDLIKITGKSVDTTVDVEIYMPDVSRRRTGGADYVD